jgi:hypothetical protein
MSDELKLQPTEPGELPAELSRYVEKDGEEQPSILVAAADGWRHSSPDFDLSSDKARKLSDELLEDSIHRLEGEDELSAGEQLFVDLAPENA